MELRDLVLSTLEELDEKIEEEKKTLSKKVVCSDDEKIDPKKEDNVFESKELVNTTDDELEFLKHTKERLQVLFEGLKSEDVSDDEQKVALILKYLQLLFAQIEQRIEAKSQ